jgi:hypothetical protein
MKGKMFGLCAILVLAGTLAWADGTADGRIAKQLDKLGIKYTTLDTGNFSIDNDLESGRTQSVYIMSSTSTYGGMEIREIWSNAGKFDAAPTAEQMMELFTDNGNRDIGAWNLEASDNGAYLAYFSIKVPVYLRDKDLSDMIDLAAAAADEMELKLFNKDEN